MSRMYLVSDFDGVLSDMSQMVIDYKERTFFAVEKITGESRKSLESLYETSGLLLDTDPTKMGWVHNDASGIAAFWNEAPQFRATATFEHMLNNNYQEVIEERFYDDHVRHKDDKGLVYNLLENHFVEAHKSVPQQVDLDKLQELYQGMQNLGSGFTIASTSRESSIRNKIGDLEVEVFGAVGKYLFDTQFTPFGTVMNIADGAHVYPVRNVMSKSYHEALESIAVNNGSADIVVGDVFTLDLALPLAMGKEIILKKNSYTPKWSENFVHNHDRGHVVDEITEIPQLIKNLMG